MRKRNLTFLALLLILALVMTGLVTGCPKPRKMPAPSPTPAPTVPAPTAPTTIRDLAADITNFVRTIGIPGVNRAETIIIGNVALVGIDLRGATPPPGPTAPGTPAPAAPGTTAPAAPGAPPPRTTAPAPGTTVPAPGRVTPGAPAPGTTGTTSPATPAPGTTGTVLPGAPTTPSDIEKTVADRVLATYPQLVDVKVTSDPNRSGRIIAIASDMRAGRAATDHMTEIARLSREIPSTPTRRVTPFPPPGPTAPPGPVGPPTPVR